MTNPASFRYFKTSPDIIQFAVMLYVRFPLSLRNFEDLLNDRVNDAAFAKETSDLAKAQILQQSATAMLGQANAAKQNVLSLLQG